MRLARAGRRRLRSGKWCRGHRSVCGHRQKPISGRACDAAPASGRSCQSISGHDPQSGRLSAHQNCLQAEPKGPRDHCANGCSTSLVAVDQACLALTAGDCDMALAGGVSLGQLEKQGYLYQPGMVFSPDVTCRAFDASAQGTIEGQGAGLVLLKPLEQALAAGDPIHAVICASAINNDGTRKIGFTAPSAEKQAAVIRQTQKKAGIQADTIGYIEAHGTGTPLGDPIEIEGLTQAFSQTTHRSQFCAIGSVKTNIGHLDAAAGIAGLIKAILCLKHKTL